MNGYAWYQLGMAHHALANRDKLDEVIAHLGSFDPAMTRQLIQATRKPVVLPHSVATHLGSAGAVVRPE